MTCFRSAVRHPPCPHARATPAISPYPPYHHTRHITTPAISTHGEPALLATVPPCHRATPRGPSLAPPPRSPPRRCAPPHKPTPKAPTLTCWRRGLGTFSPRSLTLPLPACLHQTRQEDASGDALGDVIGDAVRIRSRRCPSPFSPFSPFYLPSISLLSPFSDFLFTSLISLSPPTESDVMRAPS